MKQRFTGILMIFSILPSFYFGGCVAQAAVPISEPAPIIKGPANGGNPTISIDPLEIVPEISLEKEDDYKEKTNNSTVLSETTPSVTLLDINKSNTQNNSSFFTIGDSIDNSEITGIQMDVGENNQKGIPLSASPFYSVPPLYIGATKQVLDEYQLGKQANISLPEKTAIPTQDDILEVRKEDNYVIIYLLINRIDGTILELHFDETNDNIKFLKAETTSQSINVNKETILYVDHQREISDLAWACAQIAGLTSEQWKEQTNNTTLEEMNINEHYFKSIPPAQTKITYTEEALMKIVYSLDYEDGDTGESVLFLYKLDRNNCWVLHQVQLLTIPEETLQVE